MDEFSTRKIIKDIEQIKLFMASVDKTLALQHQSLDEHMRRSQANEKAIEMLKDELKPVVRHVISIQTIIKILSWVGASGIIVYMISRFV